MRRTCTHASTGRVGKGGYTNAKPGHARPAVPSRISDAPEAIWARGGTGLCRFDS